jgi:hypothetical protein
MSRIIKKKVTRNHNRNHKSNGRNRKSMKGGTQSDNKIKIKQILGITHDTPDNYNPKLYGPNLKDYYTKLLEIYNDVWSTSNDNEKEKLQQELTSERGRIAISRHPGRTRLYHELIEDLGRLDSMKEGLGREVNITDFAGSTCVDYGFRKCYGCHGVVFEEWAKKQEGKRKPFDQWELPEYFPIYVPKQPPGSSESIELERPPPPPVEVVDASKLSLNSNSDTPTTALSAGKSRRHRRRHHRRTNKKSRKVRRMRRIYK